MDKKKKAQLYKHEAKKLELEIKCEDYLEEIKRVEEHIKQQDNIIKELKEELGE